MSGTENDEIPMAQCGACNSIVPLDSESCPDCGVSFSGVSEEQLGECGACGAIIPIDSESCLECGASFVEHSVIDDPSGDTIEDTTEEISEEIKPVEDDLQQQSEAPGLDDVQQETSVVSSSVQATDLQKEEESIQAAPSIDDLIESGASDELDDDSVSENMVSTATETAIIDEFEAESPTISDVEMAQESNAEEPSIETPADYQSSEADQLGSENELEEDSSGEIEDYIDELLGDEDASEVSVDLDETEQMLETDGEGADENVESDSVVNEDESEEGPTEEVEEQQTETSVVMAFENLALAIAGTGMTAGEVFGEMDTSEDNLIDAPELQKGIEKIAGEKMSAKEVTAILNYLDEDGDRRINPNELVKALDDLRIGIKPGDLPKVKTFPSPLQKFLMGKKANDIYYPIAYFLMVAFIGLWVVNGMGLLVDGTGGTVVYEGGVDQWGGDIREANWNLCESDALEEMIDPCQGTVAEGETYPCDPTIDANKCENSLTPFSGENGASSMPAGFYPDGISMIILGVIGLCGVAYLHLVYAKSLRKRAKKNSENSDSEEDLEDDTPEEETEEDSEEEEEDYDSDEDEFDDEEELDDYEEEDDDDIDVGDWIGLELDGKEYFGEIIEFDDDEGTVTIETEDGDEITGDQDDMFIDEEDDE